MSNRNELDLKLKADSNKATAGLDNLISKLKEVDATLSSIDPSKIQQIADSLKGIKGVKVGITGGSGGGRSSASAANRDFARTNSLLQTLTSTSNRANKSFLNLNSTMFKLAATWGMFYATAYPFIRLLNAAWKSSQNAMDYVETYNYYSVTMDKIFKQVGEDAAETFQKAYVNTLNNISTKMTGFYIGRKGELLETYSKNLGADPERLMNYQARIGAITNAVGLMADESVNAQKALSMLSQDLSSLTNTDLESVMTNLSSGLIGQSRALYKYGIDITNATLKTYALEHGVTKAVSAMTQSEKMELRLLAILDQSKVAWGDMANTVNSVANQYRIFGQSVSNLSRVLGNLFLPIIAKVLPYVNALLISLRQMFELLGFRLYGDNWLSNVLDGISSGYSAGDIIDDMEDLADAEEDATKSAKKLKNAVMGFDELNIINDKSGGSGSGSGGVSFPLNDAIEAALADYEKVWNDAFDAAQNKAVALANRIMAFVKSGNFEGLGKYISTSLAQTLRDIDWKKVYEGAKNFGNGLADFIRGLIQPNTFAAVGATVAGALNTAIYFALAMGENLSRNNGSGWNQIGDAIAAYWNTIFSDFDFEAFGRTLGIWVGGISKTIAKAIKTINWDDLFDGIKEGITAFFEGLAESGVSIGDIAIVLGVLTIKKILKFAWGATVLKAISQSLAKGLAAKLGMELAADATLGTAIAQGLGTQLAKVPNMLRQLGGTSALGAVAGDYRTLSSAMVTTFGELATKIIGVTSIISGATLAIHEFLDMWENGFNAVSVALEALGLALTAFGAVALGIVSGPVAAVIAGFAGVASIVGILVHDNLPDFGKMLKDTLTNPGGTSVSTLTQAVADNITEIGDAFNGLNSTFSKSDELKKSIKNISEEIMTIKHSMDAGVTSVEDGVAQMKVKFEELYNATKDWYDLMAIEMIDVFGEGGVFEGALEKQGTTIEAVTKSITGLEQKELETLSAIWEEYQALSPEEKQSERGKKLLAQLANYTSDYEKIMNAFTGNIDTLMQNIDWDKMLNPDGSIDQKAFETELSKITKAIELTQQEIDNAATELVSHYEQLKQKALEQGDEESAALYDKVIKAVNTESEALKESVLQSGIDVSNALQKDLIEKMGDAIGDANSISEAMGIQNKFSEAISSASESIEKAFTDLGVSGAGWASDASKNISDSLFVYDYDENSKTYMQTKLADDWKDIITNAAEGTYEVSKENGKYIIKGIGEGADEQSDTTAEEMSEGFFSSLWKKICKFFGIESPAKEMNPIGEYIFEGIMVGFKSMFSDFDVAIKKFFDENVKPWFTLEKWKEIGKGIHEGLMNKVTEFTDWWTNTGIPDWWTNNVEPLFTAEKWTFSGIKDGLVKSFNSALGGVKVLWNTFADWINEHLTWTIDPIVIAGKTLFDGATINLGKLPKFEIPQYAIGGFPEDGLFFANHNELVGEFANGKTAVANNEQIVEGIKSGVAQAVNATLAPYLREIAANTNETANNTDSIAKKPTRSIGDRDIARANIRGQRGMGLTIRTT